MLYCPKNEAGHSPPSRAEVKNMWNYTTISPIHLHAVVLSYTTWATLPWTKVSYHFQHMAPYIKICLHNLTYMCEQR